VVEQLLVDADDRVRGLVPLRDLDVAVVDRDEPALGAAVAGDVEPHHAGLVGERRLVAALPQAVEEGGCRIGHARRLPPPEVTGRHPCRVVSPTGGERRSRLTLLYSAACRP
jgi:hypothetical protein